MSAGAQKGSPTLVGRRLESRIVELLLGLYPRPFRARYGARLHGAFVAERRSGRRRGLALWTWFLRDTLTNALPERFGSGPGSSPSHDPRPSRTEMLFALLQDLRYAARSLIAAPTYALVCVVVLAIGIGGNSTVFTLANELLLARPSGVAEPEFLVRVTRTNEHSVSGSFGFPDYAYVRDNARSLAGIVGFEERLADAGWSHDGGQRTAVGVRLVTANYFDVLGVPMHLGRAFAPQEGEPGGDGLVLVATHGFWVRSLGSDPGAVGREMRLNGRSFRLVGVAAEHFVGTGPLQSVPDLWAPVTAQPALMADGSEAWLERQPGQVINWLSVIGRRAPTASLAQVRAELERLNAELLAQFPDDQEGRGMAAFGGFSASPGARDDMLQYARLLGGVVLLVLVIVCANIAVLQLARGSTRSGEIAVRVALGAGRARIVRQLLAESLLLAAAGGLTGYLLSFWSAGLLGAWLPLPVSVTFRPDATVLAVTGLLALSAAIGFGLAPALLVTRRDTAASLEARGVAPGRDRLRAGLVVGQLALSLVLVLGACLLVRSLLAAKAVDPGFATTGRVFVSFSTGNLDQDRMERNAMLADIVSRLDAHPLVERATTTTMLPFAGAWSTDYVPADTAEPSVEVYVNAVGPGYFEAMGIPILVGRGFESADGPDADEVLVVNATAAELFWPGETPIGQSIRLLEDEPKRLVGLVGDTDYRQLGEQPQPIVYHSIYQRGFSSTALVIEARGEVAPIADLVREQVAAVEPNLVVGSVSTIEEALESQTGTYRLGALALGSFAAIAALLAAVGLYGVLSFMVAATTREIGIRMALGSSEGGVLRRVVGRGLLIGLLGVGLGMAAALATARAIAGWLYGITPHDPVSFTFVPLLLGIVVLLASAIPARRAARVDPAVALRAE